MVELRETLTILEAQMGALDQVIAIYDPEYEPAGAAKAHKTRRKRQKAPETI